MAESAALEILGRAGAGARGDGGGARHRAQVEIGRGRGPRAHQPRRHQAAAQGIRRGAEPFAPIARRSRSTTTTSAMIATSKANIGFALFGLGRASEGKRLRRRGARGIRAHRRHRRDRVAAGRIRPVSREGRRLPDGARVLPPRAQALRGDGRRGAPEVGARDAGEIRVGQEAARDRAPQSPERAQVGGARKPGACASGSGGCSPRSSRSRSSSPASTTGSFASTTASSRRRTAN